MNRWELTDYGENHSPDAGKKVKHREEIQLEMQLFEKSGGVVTQVPRCREVNPEVVREMKSALRYYKVKKRETP